MAPKRSLPDRRNPMLAPEYMAPLDILVERRRLGQTNLAVRTGQVNITNATKPESLGKFDYAHLRVPLPSDLSGSGIFTLSRGQSYPESYFLMRRSSDGYISATGMFKAAYPWASIEEEEAERQHHKKQPTAGADEVAGNIWVAPETALKLSEEYNLKTFIVALLDPATIEKGSTRGTITSPPKYSVSHVDVAAASPAQPVGSVRKRTLRSASPSKIATPGGRKIASPRKQRTTARKTKAEEATTASVNLQAALENGARGPTSSASDSVDGEGPPQQRMVNGTGRKKGGAAAPAADDTVQVAVDQATERKGDKETTTTTVKVEMPAGAPELPLPQSTEDMVRTAKEMVDAANRLEDSRNRAAAGSPTTKRGPRGPKKRKAEDLDESSDERETPQKRVKVLEEMHKRETVRTRAMVGITATLAIGAVIPYFF